MASVELQRDTMTNASAKRAPALVLLSLCGALAASGPAAAADWWYAGRGEDRVMLIDAASVQRNHGVLTYWNTQVIADGAQDGVRMIKSFMRADCAKARGGWAMIVRYDRDDRQMTVDSLAKPQLAAVTPDTLGQVELNFACATDEARREAGAFPLAIDARTFADALMGAPDPADPKDIHARLAGDPATPVVRSPAPGPETFGKRQTAKAGQPLVPPRDYAKGPDAPKAADYPPSTVGIVYDVVFQGIDAGEMRFEVRGYDVDDMIHPGSGQTEGFPVDLKTVHIRDLAISVDKVDADAITYRVKIEKEATPDVELDAKPARSR